MKKIETKRLSSGLRTILIPMAEHETATVLVLVEAGSKYESKEENGLSHFLEHMCFKGTEHRPTTGVIAAELDGMGAEYNAFTGHEYTGYYAKVASRHLECALDIVADIYVDPKLDPAEIEKEKGVIMGEIDMRNDILPSRASELFMELLYGDQPAGWPIAGPKERIEIFTRDQFLSYRRMHYLARSTTVIVAGRFDLRTVSRSIASKFRNIHNGKKSKKQATARFTDRPRTLALTKPSDQTHVVIGTEGFPVKHARIPTLTIIASILGGGMSSRLFQKMRGELGIGYYVNASHDAFTDHGVFSVSAGFDNDRVEEGVRAALVELYRLAHDGVGEDELRKVKDMIAGRFSLGLESSDEIAEFYGFQEVLRRELRSPAETLRRIERVTSRDVRATAASLFRPGALRLALVGPVRDMSVIERALEESVS